MNGTKYLTVMLLDPYSGIEFLLIAEVEFDAQVFPDVNGEPECDDVYIDAVMIGPLDMEVSAMLDEDEMESLRERLADIVTLEAVAV